MELLKQNIMAKKCMKCGGAMKMAKGGSVSKPFAAGIPYATGAGATDGKNGMMKKGGAVKKQPCEYGEYWNGTKCVKNISGKVGAAVLGAGIAGMASVLGATSDKAMARSKAREEKKAANKKIDTAAKKLTSAKVMKTGGSLKPVPSGKVGLAKLPTAVRNKMGYKRTGGSIKRK
jgi:hypothetical protein